jgi:hypothetical protein
LDEAGRLNKTHLPPPRGFDDVIEAHGPVAYVGGDASDEVPDRPLLIAVTFEARGTRAR